MDRRQEILNSAVAHGIIRCIKDQIKAYGAEGKYLIVLCDLGEPWGRKFAQLDSSYKPEYRDQNDFWSFAFPKQEMWRILARCGERLTLRHKRHEIVVISGNVPSYVTLKQLDQEEEHSKEVMQGQFRLKGNKNWRLN